MLVLHLGFSYLAQRYISSRVTRKKIETKQHNTATKPKIYPTHRPRTSYQALEDEEAPYTQFLFNKLSFFLNHFTTL